MRGVNAAVLVLGYGVWGLGSGVWGLGSGVSGLGSGVSGASASASVSAGSPGSDGLGAVTKGADGSGPVFEVDYSNPGLTPSHWVLTLNPDGTGHFWTENGNGGNANGSRAAVEGQPPPQAVDRDIKVSAEFVRHVFESARQHKLFSMECESHMKVAFQGWKKLSYRGPEGQGSCGFNYSKDQQLQALGESLVAVAETILEGSRLEWLLRYDRLGLDREMDYVMDGSADGRLQELGTIRGTLERLAEDESVLERVRKRARMLLARVKG